MFKLIQNVMPCVLMLSYSLLFLVRKCVQVQTDPTLTYFPAFYHQKSTYPMVVVSFLSQSMPNKADRANLPRLDPTSETQGSRLYPIDSVSVQPRGVVSEFYPLAP